MIRSVVGAAAVAVLAHVAGATASESAPNVEFQPLAAQTLRLIDALAYLGEPLPEADVKKLREACQSADGKAAVQTIQKILDEHSLIEVSINPESRVKAKPGAAPRTLMQQGWRNYLVKVVNEAGVTAELKVTSPNSLPLYKKSSNDAEPKEVVKPGDVPHRFLDAVMYNTQPLSPTLTGLGVEYRILQLYCRDAGKRDVTLGFHVGQGTQDIGFRNEVALLFDAQPATEVKLKVKDVDGSPAMGSFIFRDKLGRVYPSQARRLAPDFFFHPQVYRQDGESVMLPPGDYAVEFGRGPEYYIDHRDIHVPAGGTHMEEFQLRRWIDLKKLGWWSGDHHVHAAGCAHYENPTQGVTPEDMFRHVLGEDLNVGCVLSWGPCWYFQKQYFEGKVSHLSRPNYLMRYDVEVSGFPSSHTGHLCLLNLKEDDYPGTTRIEQWPSWDLPVLKWGKEQGGVVGFSHSGWGLSVDTTDLPNYVIPPFDGIGANEYIVDVAHDVCDFISSVDTPAVWELNIWYHTLNCGFRCKLSGETDFPCIYGQRVGLGRIYVQLPGELDFTPWVERLKEGRSYVSDGLSHLIDFQVNDRAVGADGGQLDLEKPGNVVVTAKIAALLGEKPDDSIRNRKLHEQPYWHIERARIGDTRNVPVELIVNGQPVARTEILADGQLRDIKFEAPIEISSWVALRVFPSSHTNPVFVQVAGKPIRASKRSAEWCVKSVDQCWRKKKSAIRASERSAAEDAFKSAREIYKQRLAEAERD